MALIHTLLGILLIGPFVLLLVGYWRGRRQPLTPPEKHVSILLIINSTMLYALAYNVIYFVQEFFLAVGKQSLGLTAYLYHNNHNWEGTHPKEALMQGSGAISIFILGILLWLAFLSISHWKSWWRIFVLWLAYHGLVQSLPQLSSAPLDRNTDVGQALTYLGLSPTVEIALAALSILAIIGVSYIFSRYFLALGHPSVALNHPFKRTRTVWHGAVLPAIIGTALLFPYRIPPADRYQMTFMLLFVSIPSVFAFAWVGKAPKPIGNEARGRILVLPIILTIGVLLFFQLVLRPGIVFSGG
ncbi:MAG: hypothetical protein R3330_05060 [Saprospiraceae bacterium]|nr:hypothetical protein [Saprospiraceae bacterium]